jgi:hypothetical protein
MTIIPSDHVDLLEQIEKERKKSEGKWRTETTRVKVNPNLKLELEKQDSDSPIHKLLEWKQIETVPQIQECLEKFRDTLMDSEDTTEKSILEAQLVEQFPNVPDLSSMPWQRSPQAQMILDLYDRIFDHRVKIKKHSDFPDELFMVDLSFMPENFFYDDSHEYMGRYYRACVAGDSTIAPKMQTSHMRFCDISGRDTGRALHQDFTFPGGKRQTEYIHSIFSQLLEEYAGKPAWSEFECAVSFLFTLEERQQDPHVDYRHATMQRYQQLQSRDERGRGRKRKSTEDEPKKPKDLPWSLDMPLQKGGLRLAFYGCDDGTVIETPEVMHVPFRHVLFWRGDCIHAGCLADLLGGHGFRMHAYIPLHEAQRQMSLTTLPEIEWHDENNRRYTERLRRYDGTEFPKGNERV